MKGYFLLAFTILSLCCSSCRTRTCHEGRPYLGFNGFDSSELDVIEVKEYEPGNGWSKVNATFYTGYAIKAKSSDSVPWQSFRITASSYYTFRILKSNTTYSVYGIQYEAYKHRESIIGGEPPHCVNACSYWINTKNYKVARQDNLSYSSGGYGFPLVISRE